LSWHPRAAFVCSISVFSKDIKKPLGAYLIKLYNSNLS
jgi:hypothetical protein